MGCQHMFVSHFEKRDTERYRAHKARYESFHTDDICTICDVHHKEIHKLYGPIIGKHCLRLRKPMCRWTWKQAEILMKELEDFCLVWLTRP